MDTRNCGCHTLKVAVVIKSVWPWNFEMKCLWHFQNCQREDNGGPCQRIAAARVACKRSLNETHKYADEIDGGGEQ